MTFSGLSESGNGFGYHENMLIARFRPEAVAGATAMGAADEMSEQMPGLSVLQQFEQRNLIQQVAPIGNIADEQSSSGAGILANAIANSQPAPANGDPTAGVNFIHLDEAADLEQLQTAMESDPTVAYVSRVPVRFLSPVSLQDNTAVPTPKWNLGRIQWEEAKKIPGFKSAEDIRVAVLDTGVQVDHPDLDGRIAKYTYEHLHLPVPATPYDISGHGTHVAGVISALPDNEYGIDGLSNAQILAWKIFNDAQYQYVETDPLGNQWYTPLVDPLLYYRALSDCIRDNVDVINLSIGGPMQPDAIEQQLIDNLLQKGTTIVASMGNARHNGSPTMYPAAIDGVLAVGATDPDDNVAPFSNAGDHIALCAPGVGIWSTLPTYPGQGYMILDNSTAMLHRQMRRVEFAAWDGTSMAAPHVTGAVALVLANGGRMNGTAVRELLVNTADQIPGMNGSDWHPDYGAGRLNLLWLLSAI